MNSKLPRIAEEGRGGGSRLMSPGMDVDGLGQDRHKHNHPAQDILGISLRSKSCGGSALG